MENFIVNPGLHKPSRKGQMAQRKKEVTQRVVPSLAQEETTKRRSLLLMQGPPAACNFPSRPADLKFLWDLNTQPLLTRPTDLTCH